MKFFVVEGNLGEDATRDQVDQLIELLRKKGWEVEYGARRNKASDVSEFGREEEIQDAFSNDFMNCLAEIEN